MSLERLKKALEGIKGNYSIANEHGLVAEGAAKHGVKLSPGGMFDAMEMTDEDKGAYNARVVREDEDISALAESLQTVESLTVICEDYRQSAQVAEELNLDIAGKKDAVFAMAGGPTQPMEGENSGRYTSLVEFILAFHAVNPNAVIRLIAHDAICGGHKHYIGTAAAARKAVGVDGEDEVMISDLDIIAQELIQKDSSIRAVLEGSLAEIDGDNHYIGMKKVEFAAKQAEQTE